MDILENIEKLIEEIIREKAVMPVLAKISKVDSKEYTCDCVELTNEGEPSSTIYTRVQIPKLLASKDGGIFLTPNKGTIVLLNFLNGDRNYPIISAVMGGRHSPDSQKNTCIIKIGETEVRLDDHIKISSGASEVLVNKNGTIDIKNSNTSLAGLMKDIISDISTVKTVDGKPLSPDDILKLQALSIKIDSLLGE